MDRPRRILIYTDLEHTARRQMVQGVGRYARVEWDDEQAGRLAVEHLVGLGMRRIYLSPMSPSAVGSASRSG